jgi:hypothetical protein
MSDQQSADFGALISREQAENAFADALRLFVGRRRRYSVDQLAKGSGVPKRLIECFRGYPANHPDFRPLHFGHMLSLVRFLGADFTNEWLSLAGQGAFDLPDEEPDPGDLAADTTDDAATVVRAAMDRKFDKHEKPALKVVGARMISRGAQLVAVGGRR